MIKEIIQAGLIILMGASCTSSMTVISPGKNNRISLELDEQGRLYYSIYSNSITAVEKSLLGMDIEDAALDFNSGIEFLKAEKTVINEIYTLPTGKTSSYTNKANETDFIFKNKHNKLLHVTCRAYDDGVAFRYIVENPGKITIKKENTRFNFPKNTKSWMMDYRPDYENSYPERTLDTIGIRPLSFPALLLNDKKLWVLFTEASVYDQPATHIQKAGSGNELKIEFPEPQFSVESKWVSPWRTFIIGTRLATIVETVMVENLNPPSVISDMSWIRPGVAVFPWWGNFMANSYLDTLKTYVDLASEMNWEWIEFDVSLVGSPLRTSKLWETTAWLPELTAYAKAKGISVYGWDEINVLNSSKGREHVFGKYVGLGIKGIKIDYIDSDKQYAMRFRKEAMEDAALKKLAVSFHGETLPHGQRRTYPNVLTLEAVRGAEFYIFSPAPTPAHNCTLPFTRNVVGPMDYTPVTFTIRPENPRITTYAHELALSVVFESGWQVMADRPKEYLHSPAKEFLKKLESAWDETRFIDGYPGKFICLARRKANKWFIAGINAGKERTVTIPLNFITSGKYSIEIYEDNPNEKMTNLHIRKETIASGAALTVTMLENGGFCTLVE